FGIRIVFYIYNLGPAVYEVAIAYLLLHGVPVGCYPYNIFPAIRSDQGMIWLPAAPEAAPCGGYISPTEMKIALNYNLIGVQFVGKYKLS
ncbi:hypothetical protein MMK25_31090, partial [Bacillus cereus]|nr:hypothetical protein [Bacillus cereus]